MCLHVLVCMETRGQPRTSSIFKTVSHCPVVKLDRLAIEPQESSLHWPPRAEIRSMCSCAWLFAWVLGIQFGFLLLASKHHTDCTVSPALLFYETGSSCVACASLRPNSPAACLLSAGAAGVSTTPGAPTYFPVALVCCCLE